MDYQSVINLVAGAAFSVLGWFARELWTAVNNLKADLSKLREDLPKTYVTREDFKSDVKEIKEMLSKIFDRLENKADK
jgi:cell division protein FtsB